MANTGNEVFVPMDLIDHARFMKGVWERLKAAKNGVAPRMGEFRDALPTVTVGGSDSLKSERGARVWANIWLKGGEQVSKRFPGQ